MRTATYKAGEKATIFAFATIVFVAVVGTAFAAGFAIGRILL